MVYDALIVGGGILGVATAREYLKRKPGSAVLILEKEDRLAAHQTGHNSGVMHSGIYYAPGSQKAITCRKGLALLKALAEKHNLPFEVCGKLIVATREEEVPRLEALKARGEANGLQGLKTVSAEDIPHYEPQVRGLKALWVPETGIIDYGKVTEALLKEVKTQGGDIRYEFGVTNIIPDGTEWIVVTEKDAFSARAVVNCAGLHSDDVARFTSEDLPLRIIPFRGEYYSLAPHRRHWVRNLIYPVPDPRYPFLGVHFTRRISGEVEAGPNAVLALKKEGYGKWDFAFSDVAQMLAFKGTWHLAREHWKTGLMEQWRSWVKAAFVNALQELIPDLSARDIVPGGSGVRAQAVDRNGKLVDDFVLITQGSLLHVLNAPSPAATASLAIAQTIVDTLKAPSA